MVRVILSTFIRYCLLVTHHVHDFPVHVEGEYIDLSQNPEKFTGYAGQSAHSVWGAIYNENCFGLTETTATTLSDQSPTTTIGLDPDQKEECLEKRVYYRVISGKLADAEVSTR